MKAVLMLFFCLPLAAAEPTLVYFVRHAEKVDASEDPDLSAAGASRVAMLRRFFEKTKLDLVVSSQYQRTRKTVAPMAEDRGLAVTVIPAGEPEKLIELIEAHPGNAILVSGHSNTIPELIGRLGCGTVSIDDAQYSFLFLAVLGDKDCALQVWQLDP